MIFLIVKIFVYLVVAAITGGAAGWLMRNLQAQKSEEETTRAMNDAKSKLPQLEAIVRGRDDLLKKAKTELDQAKNELNEQVKENKSNQQKAREQERELKRLQQSAEAHSATDSSSLVMEGEGLDGDANGLIAELSQEINRLKAELDAGGAAGGQGVAKPDAVDESLMQVEFDARQVQLNSVERKLSRAEKDLSSERDKLREFYCERELQTNSIHVLHQQLEMERSRRTANV